MHMYSLQKGRQGLLVLPNGDVTSYQLSENKAYVSDDIVMDPIRLCNNKRQGFYTAPTTEFEKTAERLAKQGYAVFEKAGKQSGDRYGFAVIITENDSEMD